MSQSNLERMIQLAENVFATKNDPDQLDVDQDVLEQLRGIHQASISELTDGNGPVAWVLVIPTTSVLMNRFLNSEISEKELFELTPVNSIYDALYLCSALVLEEYRRKGIAKQLTINAIKQIQEDHPIVSLFVWAFSREGELCSETIAEITGLPLYKRCNLDQVH